MQQTPIERAVATYRRDWECVEVNTPGYAAVNPETLVQKTDADFAFRYIDISSVDRGVVNWDSVQVIRYGDAPSRARRVVRRGDLIISTVRPLLGSHTHAGWDQTDFTVCSTGFAVIRSGTKLLPEYLKHLPFTEQVTRQMIAWQCGTNYPAVNERDIRKIKIPAPPIDEQAAIAHVLDAVDTAIDRARDAVAEARELRNALVQDFFYSALGVTAYADRPTRKLPAGWTLSPTENLLAFEPKNGVSPKSSSQPPGVPTFSIAAIRDGRVDLTTLENLKYADVNEKVADKFRLEKGDVLIVRGNANPDLVGKSGRVSEFPEGCIYPDITKRIVLHNAGDTIVTPDYFVLAWNHPVIHNQVLRRAKTSNGTLKINNRDVKQIVMPVPPATAQGKIVEVANAVESKIDAISAKIDALVQLKKSLMHDLLTGTMRVAPNLFKELKES